jgi:hypothetical protein
MGLLKTSIVIGLVLGLAPWLAFGQTASAILQPDSPMQLQPGNCGAANSVVSSPNQHWIECQVLIKNVSAESVTAYTLLWHYPTPGGQMTMSAVSKFALDQKQAPLFAPGAGSTRSVTLMTNSSALQVEVDFVMFGNGTYWGADKDHTLRRIQENLATQMAMRRAILNQMNSKGADAVKQDLTKQTGDPSQEKYMKAQKVQSFRRYTEER